MKKVLVVLFVLLALGTFAFAKQGFTVRGGIGYDFVNIKAVPSEDGSIARPDDAIWRANAFGTEFALTYNFSDTIQLYTDTTLGFYNKFKIGDYEIKKGDNDKMSFLATAEHTGIAYNINLGKNMDLQVGGGIAMEYARVTASSTNPLNEKETIGLEAGIFSFGVGLYANFDYSFSEKLALAVTVHPDVMFISADHVNETTSHIEDKTVVTNTTSLTTFGAATSFKFNAAVGVKFAF